ncbi:MAG: 30S ribosomal protein S16 [Candidatus Vogelbacteria bacterium RIFOXYD1_FULL_44_32]|uniref:30S ribosomal protein S16 n=1 Tax=Candidatus Vogelbacteria bacterium RIFOXYD1_FULL_44_32 TaxID=1802438 RepID=A0A1G2QCH0_9BACT|nr:MAG: 30S ribosomal protein S16 [Candidatus Vogelbacteria bacterium RIFOXYD1_FULL_44_32]
MLKLRLQRVGRKNDPSFRVVVTESQNGPQSGKFLEVLGSYDARQGVPQLKGDRIKHWIAMGAQVSATMHNMLVRFGVIEGKKINNLPALKPVEPKADSSATEAKPEAKPEGVEEKTEEVKAEAEVVAEEPVAEAPVVEAPAEVAEPAEAVPAPAEVAEEVVTAEEKPAE